MPKLEVKLIGLLKVFEAQNCYKTLIGLLKVFEAQNCYKTEEKGLKTTGHSLLTSMIKILSKNLWF